jgi:hypothetical protein
MTGLQFSPDLSVTYDRSAVFSRFFCDIWQVCSFLQICLWHMTGLQFSPDLSVKYDRTAVFSRFVCEIWQDCSFLQIGLWHMIGLQFSCRPVIFHRQIWRKLQTCHMSQTNLEKTADLSYVTDKSGENCRPVSLWHMTGLQFSPDLSVTYDRSAVFSRFVCDTWQVCSFLQICLWHMTGLQFSPDLSVTYDRFVVFSRSFNLLH